MLRLTSVVNFRDIGGVSSQAGGQVRRGVVYRSGHLADLAEEDRRTLEALGIRKVIDFRTASDVSADGGSGRIPGAVRVACPMGDPANAPFDIRRMLTRGAKSELARHLGDGQAADIMARSAEALVLEQREGYGRMLRALAGPEGVPAIVHCTAGKDRTGWAASLLLWIAGAAEDAIVDHYLESNLHRAEDNAAVLDRMPDDEIAEWVRPFMEVRPEYARASMAAVRREWGDVDAYVRDGLGVSDEDLATLRERLVER